MLTDDRINRFIDDFSRQWLQLHRVGMFPPDKKALPHLRRLARDEHAEEPVEYFREMLAKNLPIDGFLDPTGRWPTLGSVISMDCPSREGRIPARLAQARGPSRRSAHDGRGAGVDLGRNTPPPGASRRLAQRSDLQQRRRRHLRPMWIRSSRFRPREQDHRSARELKHTLRTRSCAACHRNIDPLGLALDQYDAIGQWRTLSAFQQASARIRWLMPRA